MLFPPHKKTFKYELQIGIRGAQTKLDIPNKNETRLDCLGFTCWEESNLISQLDSNLSIVLRRKEQM